MSETDVLDVDKLPLLERPPHRRAFGQVDVPFDGSTRSRCQWPTWLLEQKTGNMCGISIDPHKPFRYCAFHYRIAYNPRANRT